MAATITAVSLFTGEVEGKGILGSPVAPLIVPFRTRRFSAMRICYLGAVSALVDLRRDSLADRKKRGRRNAWVKRERYEPGTFSSVDLSTSDADGARVFYGELFGWEFEDSEIPGGGVYTMCHVQGDAVAAIVQQDEQPGHWNNYLTVLSADKTAAKARQLGANVFEEPFDVMVASRMAVFADPTGAVLCIWQPRAHIGARRVNDAGCLAWNEFQSSDPEAATAFYARLLGWESEPMEEDGKLVYLLIRNAGSSNGGIMPMTEQYGGAPPHWLAHFTVSSCNDAVAKVRELGGEALVEPLDLGPAASRS
jgi:predicted enzyme related to lactoylglutathione lyase